jgi:hypothetical protein
MSCTFNGHTDWYGQGGAYRDAFERKITRRILAENPDVPEDRIERILKNIRDNYLGEAATRAKGMLQDAIVLQAVKDNQIPGAKIAKRGGKSVVIIEETVKDKTSGETVPKMVPVLDDEGIAQKDKDGNVKEVPSVLTYVPGSMSDVPTVLHKAVSTAVKQSGKKNLKVPVRYGGPARGKSGANQGTANPPIVSESVNDALAVLTTNVDRVNGLLMAQGFHTAAEEIVDSVLRPDVEKKVEIGNVLENAGNLLLVAARILHQDPDAKPEDLDPFRSLNDKNDKNDQQ